LKNHFGDQDAGLQILAARFEQEHLRILVFSQASRHDRAGRAGTNDDVVMLDLRVARRAAWLAAMAMNLSAATPIAGAGRPRFAARSMKVARSISRVSSWPSNSASFTPFEADAVSNMVVLLAVGSRLSPDPYN
jgi:hypothetical protein